MKNNQKIEQACQDAAAIADLLGVDADAFMQLACKLNLEIVKNSPVPVGGTIH